MTVLFVFVLQPNTTLDCTYGIAWTYRSDTWSIMTVCICHNQIQLNTLGTTVNNIVKPDKPLQLHIVYN